MVVIGVKAAGGRKVEALIVRCTMQMQPSKLLPSIALKLSVKCLELDKNGSRSAEWVCRYVLWSSVSV